VARYASRTAQRCRRSGGAAERPAAPEASRASSLGAAALREAPLAGSPWASRACSTRSRAPSPLLVRRSPRAQRSIRGASNRRRRARANPREMPFPRRSSAGAQRGCRTSRSCRQSASRSTAARRSRRSWAERLETGDHSACT